MERYFLADEGMYDAIKQDHGGLLFPGIYRLHIVGNHQAFLPLTRLLGTDPDGILYIGTSAAVPNRVGALKKSISAAYGRSDYTDVSPHQTGKKIAKIPKFISHFPFEQLCITVSHYLGEPEALDTVQYGRTILEAKLLGEYRICFGENPALND